MVVVWGFCLLAGSFYGIAPLSNAENRDKILTERSAGESKIPGPA